MDDLHWLSRQRLYGAVADVDRTIGRGARPDYAGANPFVARELFESS